MDLRSAIMGNKLVAPNAKLKMGIPVVEILVNCPNV